jgi:glycerophosphoryl diester phosphodiesterase
MEIIAHRGASHAAPENTLAAAKLAWAEGADALEVDVHLTKDGKLAIIHDENTKRVAGVALAVAQSTMEELRRLDVGRWKHPQYAGEKIPALEDVLREVPRGKRIFIEVKGGPEVIPPLERCLTNARLSPEQVVIIAFDFATVAEAKRSMPHHAAAWILDDDARTRATGLEEFLRRSREAGFDGIDLSVRWSIDGALVQRAREAGLKFYVWTVDDPAAARRLAAAGVDGLTTNRPGWLRTQLGG